MRERPRVFSGHDPNERRADAPSSSAAMKGVEVGLVRSFGYEGTSGGNETAIGGSSVMSLIEPIAPDVVGNHIAVSTDVCAERTIRRIDNFIFASITRHKNPNSKLPRRM